MTNDYDNSFSLSGVSNLSNDNPVQQLCLFPQLQQNHAFHMRCLRDLKSCFIGRVDCFWTKSNLHGQDSDKSMFISQFFPR